jgi:glycosyltransferase involved in cell wall biosynthesis
MKYSICATVYNSNELVNEFLDPLIKTEHEIVIVDGMSKDGTDNSLKKYGKRLKLISKKCTRGMGRKLAIQLAESEYIILIDFDIKISSINHIIKLYEQLHNKNEIIDFHLSGGSCRPSVYIGPKSLFIMLDAWPDMNCFEDMYFQKICKTFNVYRVVDVQSRYKCMSLRNMLSGKESRYEIGFFKKVSRRLNCTAEALFFTDFSFSTLMKYYHIQGLKKFYVGLPEYIAGKILSHFINVVPLGTKIYNLKQKYTEDHLEPY